MNTSRRKFIKNSLKATVITTIGVPVISESAALLTSASTRSVIPSTSEKSAGIKFTQIALPYSYSALEPSIDSMTMDIHYNKHHAAYIKNVNDAIAAESIDFASEKEFFANISRLSAKARNNGGGAWNHNFFWQIMTPKQGANPTGKIADAINGAFGSFDKFKELFTQSAMTRFGSGWAWLVLDNGKLKVGSTPNQDNPLMDNSELKGTPLLALDVWEHAYYLKYQNKRNEYVANWWNVVNWNEVASRLS
jgi:superoxide dismutase, Fe-Mn family